MKDDRPRCKKCGTVYIHLRDTCPKCRGRRRFQGFTFASRPYQKRRYSIVTYEEKEV